LSEGKVELTRLKSQGCDDSEIGLSCDHQFRYVVIIQRVK